MNRDSSGRVLANSILGIFLALSFLAGRDSHGFSIGATQGVSCGSPGVPVPCDFAELLITSVYNPVHQRITMEALESFEFERSRMFEIADANAQTDQDQSPEIHFDNESFAAGVERIHSLYETITGRLSMATPISRNDLITLRGKLGQAIHSIQDFYSHSNWIYFRPGVYPEFWKPGEPAVALLLQNLNGTQPCQQSPDSVGESNWPPHSGQSTDVDWFAFPSSGYARSPLSQAGAPLWKCAHGLTETGIHKDWPGRKGHEEAYQHAVEATRRFVRAVLTHPGNLSQNVCLFRTGQPCN